MTAIHLRRGLQENLLILLAFDLNAGKTIRHLVPLPYFEGLYQKVARRIYHHLDQFGAPPAQHLPDLFEEELTKSPDDNLISLIADIRNTRQTIQPDYVLDQLSRFMTLQSLKSGIIQAAEALELGTPEGVERAEEILQKTTKTRTDLFNPGLFLGDNKSLEFLNKKDEASIKTGIPQIDYYNLGPARKELHVLLGLSNRGKTWWLVHLGKMALRHRFKVCHITLEMSEERVSQRYFQSLFAVGKKSTVTTVQRFNLDAHNSLESLEQDTVTAAMSFDDPDIKPKLRQRMQKWKSRIRRLLIKEFPTGQLTVSNLRGYLDLLESSTGFVPDLLLIDYLDLMSLDSSNYRLDLGRLYKEIRGLAVERNLAVATVTQANRSAVNATQLTSANISEDFSKYMTADIVLTYNQTAQESELGLARLQVSKARNDRAGVNVLVSQNYDLGQFVLDSALIKSNYWNNFKHTSDGGT